MRVLFRIGQEARTPEIDEFITAGGNDDIILRIGAVRNERLAVFKKAHADADMVAACFGVFVSESEVAQTHLPFL